MPGWRDAIVTPPLEASGLLQFWFGDAPHDARATWVMQRQRWFGKDAALDAEIRNRFKSLCDRAAGRALTDWERTPQGRLALIVLLDQCPRNMFRATRQAFAADCLALKEAQAMVDTADDLRLHAIERVFVYLPFEHAEDGAAQQRSVSLFTALRNAVPESERSLFDNFLGYAVRHHDVIASFGRFPHRNAALGRPSTPQEVAFLQQPGSGF
ncbi:MAG: DUF924 domain-containing protein [Proteobacteria bacterium]|nr:DUF924 domain-containing protein [Pseudomonadota bacterium]